MPPRCFCCTYSSLFYAAQFLKKPSHYILKSLAEKNINQKILLLKFLHNSKILYISPKFIQGTLTNYR